MLADGRPKIVIIVSLTFQNCCVTFYLSIILIQQITGKLLRDIAAKAATPILIRAAVCELYMKFFTSLYHIIFFIYFSFYFFFIDPRRLYDEIESTKSRNRVIAILQSLSRGIEIFPFAFATLCK